MLKCLGFFLSVIEVFKYYQVDKWNGDICILELFLYFYFKVYILWYRRKVVLRRVWNGCRNLSEKW